MAPHDVWPRNVEENEQDDEHEKSNAAPPEAFRDAAQASDCEYNDGRISRYGGGTGRFFYPAAVIAGALFLIALAAV